MNNSSPSGLFASANSSTSTLRPRNTRLISYQDDQDDPITYSSVLDQPETIAISTSASSSRNPSTRPSRVTTPSADTQRIETATKRQTFTGFEQIDQERGRSVGARHRASVTGLWDSWSSIQGITSTLLGSDPAERSQAPKQRKEGGVFKTPIWMKQDRATSPSVATRKWGPEVNHTASETTPGSIEERQALVQSKRREALLLATAAENRDSTGRFKRRDSNQDVRSLRDPDTDGDALVYHHPVGEQDTLAGVMIKYGCQPDVFRKVNRFWPNDNIQTRTFVYLPVDACTVHGTKVGGPSVQSDLLDSGLDSMGVSTKGSLQSGEQVMSPSESSVGLSLTLSRADTLSDDPDIKHDSWQQLPSFPSPTEILRMPRRKLGYFPRTRRKSNNNNLSDISSTSLTPKTSFDMLRHPPTHAASMSLSLNSSPVRRSKLPPPVRLRSSSTSQPNFIDALHGPGGVGTLGGLRTEASRPGPAEDALNRKFAHYFPDLAPPRDIPSTGLRPTLRSTPRVSTDSIRSSRSNTASSTDFTATGGGGGSISSSNSGGTLEGWMRKIAGTSSSKRERNPAPKMGDLIELETNSSTYDFLGGGLNSSPFPQHNSSSSSSRSRNEQKDNDDDNDDRTPTPTAATYSGSGTHFESVNLHRDGDVGNDEEAENVKNQALLDERFPMRGRVRTAYTHGQ